MTLTEPISDHVSGSYDLAWNNVLRQRIIDRIALALDTQLPAKVGVQVIRSPITLCLPGYDPVQPALVLLDAGNTDYANTRQISAIPTLLIDVSSSAVPVQESEMKLATYAQAGVPEYWIVRPLERDLLIYSRPDPVLEIYTQLTVIAPDGEVRSPTLPFRAAVASFFAADR